MASKRTPQRSIVGLDIEPSYVAAAEVSVNGSILLQRAVSAPLDPGVMRDGEVTDADALTETLRELWSENKLPKRVRLGVANQRIVVRTLELPRIDDDKELGAAVRFQAQEHLPMSLEDAVFDFQRLDVVQGELGERQRVLVVAARRDMISRLLAVVRAAGLRPEGIDVSAFAMIRAVAARGAGDGATLYVHVGGLTNVAVADHDFCHFTRVVGNGHEAIVGQLAERRGLTLVHSREWLSHVGLASPLDSIEGDAQIVADARNVLADGTRRIADDVRQSLDFYRAQPDALEVKRAILTGPAVAIPGFAQQFSADLGIPVDVATVGEAEPGTLDDDSAGRFTIAAGLAVMERPS